MNKKSKFGLGFLLFGILIISITLLSSFAKAVDILNDDFDYCGNTYVSQAWWDTMSITAGSWTNHPIPSLIGGSPNCAFGFNGTNAGACCGSYNSVILRTGTGTTTNISSGVLTTTFDFYTNGSTLTGLNRMLGVQFYPIGIMLEIYPAKFQITNGTTPLCNITLQRPFNISINWVVDLNSHFTTISLENISNSDTIFTCYNDSIPILSPANPIRDIWLYSSPEVGRSWEQYMENLLIVLANTTSKFVEGTPCTSDNQCYTDYCLNGVCSLKPFFVGCYFDYECLSGECLNGRCTKPSLSQILTDFKDALLGDDTETANIISVIIIIIVAFLLSKVNILLGLFSILPMSILLTVIGWLSVFLTIGFFVLIVGGTIAFFFLGKGGS